MFYTYLGNLVPGNLTQTRNLSVTEFDVRSEYPVGNSMLPVMDVSVISLDEDPSLFGRRDPSSERRVKKDGLKKVPEFNSKCVADTAK